MVADGIAEIRFHTSSHSEYLKNFQEILECMEENMCILNEKTEARVKTLQVTIEDFEGTTAYIKGQVARNMQMIETVDQKIHNTIEACLSPMNQKIDDLLQSLSNLESVYEGKLDHMQNHVTAQDRYISSLETSIAELSKASASSSTSPFQAFSEQVQRQLDSLSSDIANLSKSNFEKKNSSAGDISSLQKTVQLLVDEVKAIKEQSSSSDLSALQQKVASTDSKLDLILAKLSGSNERPPEPEGQKIHKTRSSQSPIIHQIPDSPNEFEKRRHEKIESLDKMVADARLKAQQNRAKIAEKEKELVRQQGIKDPSLRVPRRKDVYFSKPLTISEPITQPKLSQTDPKDKGKQKIIFKSKKELVKEAQMEVDEEVAKQLKAKELNSKQEMLLKRKSSEISTEERSTWHDEQYRVSLPKRTIFFNPDRDSYQKVKVIKPTNSFTPPSEFTKENWDIPAPPNGMKFNLWPSAIYPLEVNIDIEEIKKRFFLKKLIQVVPVWSKSKIASNSKIDIRKFRKMPYAFFQGRRTDKSEFMFSEADFPKINQADIRSLIIWLKQRVSTDKAYAEVLQRLRQYVLDMLIDFSVDWEIRQLREKEVEEPNLDLSMENESPGNILKKPHKGVVFSSKGRLKFMRISQKHLFSSEFIKGIIGLLKRTGDHDESLRVKIIEEISWFLSFRQWLINLRNKV
ncbi:unnamed protein product [Lactuca virosa]|uniref:Uncharacterized protein n=1 Tax=Lactuca virosa TaxID=75947 RepID=A0AAU9LGZ0_9ASTR|nr:unnamed protein product [Lactuca virosa]